MNGTYDIGILGGGQLARMSIMAAQRMGLRCLSLETGDVTPASEVAPAINGSWRDVDTVASVFGQCAVVTLENEFVPARTIRRAMSKAGRDPSSLVPGIDCLEVIQDKLLQRKAFEEAGVPSPKAVALDADGSLAVSQIGFPMVLKSRMGGYDGKGVRVARNENELELHRNTWEGGGWLAEKFVDFKRELAVMVMISGSGASAYPTMESVQVNHVCDLVFPAEDVDASQIAIGAVMAVHGNGLFGVELFETKDGKILVNEIAPRPHNSGHYSMDWGGASQFQQHVRLVLGLPPAPLDGIPTCMANILGVESAGEYRRGLAAAIGADPGVFVHWYGKEETRPGRKMGHINVCGVDAVKRAIAARERFMNAWRHTTPSN